MLQTQDSKVLVDCGVKFEENDPATPMFWLGEVQPKASRADLRFPAPPRTRARG